MPEVSNLSPGRKAWSHVSGGLRALEAATLLVPLLARPPFPKAHLLLHLMHVVGLPRKVPWGRDQTEGVHCGERGQCRTSLQTSRSRGEKESRGKALTPQYRETGRHRRTARAPVRQCLALVGQGPQEGVRTAICDAEQDASHLKWLPLKRYICSLLLCNKLSQILWHKATPFYHLSFYRSEVQAQGGSILCPGRVPWD